MRLAQAHHATIGTWPHEPTALQAFHQQTHAVAAPPQHFDQIATLAAEHEHVAAERISLQHGLDLRSQAFIKAEESVPKAARSPDLLATRFVMLIGKLFAAEARSAKWTPERRQ
ncbi:hypothetical protein J103_24505 [Burkholderia pseudomallei MSHR5855]|nr:hypothetical protein J103_24505 [Burkholderia pseudomallei MSHR5855]